jgi:hypothetical protein
MLRFAWPTLVLVVAACDFPLGVCTDEARSSFLVTVVDSATGANLAPAATVRVTEGSFSDTLWASPPGTARPAYSGIFERPGVYEVTVSHPDYLLWRRSDVRVSNGRCHVELEVFTARLRKR